MCRHSADHVVSFHRDVLVSRRGCHHTNVAESENQVDGLLVIFTLTFLQPSVYILLKYYGVNMATAAVIAALMLCIMVIISKISTICVYYTVMCVCVFSVLCVALSRKKHACLSTFCISSQTREVEISLHFVKVLARYSIRVNNIASF